MFCVESLVALAGGMFRTGLDQAGSPNRRTLIKSVPRVKFISIKGLNVIHVRYCNTQQVKNKIRQGKTELNKNMTRQNETRSGQTRQGRTRQDNYGITVYRVRN